MIEVTEKENVKIVEDTDNPHIYLMYYRCAECKEWVLDEETVWVNPMTKKATFQQGNPYHVDCAPEEE